MTNPWTIVARKPRFPLSTHPDDAKIELVIIQRDPDAYRPWVVATITPQSLICKEWYWGHYFATFQQALEYFNKGVV